MAEQLKPDLCVIGAGVAGLAAATAAAAHGASVVLVEKGRMGGGRLNTACVPMAAMIAAARRAEVMRGGAPFGLAAAEPDIAFDAVNDHIHQVIAALAPDAAPERLAALGIRVIAGAARFRDTRTLVVGPDDDVAHEIRARHFIVATGARPFAPDIAGLDQVAYLTSETAFELRERPRHLIVIGAGPTGLELAQAFRRLGSEVTVLEESRPLGLEDPECAAVVIDALEREGVGVRAGVRIARVRRQRQRIEVVLDDETGECIQGSDLLVAAGRRPNVAGLGLEAARVRHGPGGVRVDRRFGTSNKRIYAIGDVIERSARAMPSSTHAAAHEAALLVEHLLFWRRVRVQTAAVPRVTFTDPELAHVGWTAPARETFGPVRVLRWAYRDNDRAQATRETRGHVKIVTDTKGSILGATIVGAAAGEQIGAWALAIAHGLDIRAMADLVVPHPTYAESGRQAAATFLPPPSASSWGQRLRRLLRRLG